jgi:hypothetical protein
MVHAKHNKQYLKTLTFDDETEIIINMNRVLCISHGDLDCTSLLMNNGQRVDIAEAFDDVWAWCESREAS